MILGADVRAALGVEWPLIPSVDDGSQKRTVRPWKALQGVAAARPYDALRAEMWSIPTGVGIGTVVLDFDGAAGEAQRLAWGLTAPHVRTGSGGHHVYVRHPGWKAGARTYAGAVPGVDVRGDGGVAHVAGSSLRGPYEVLRPLYEPLDLADLCPEAAACIVRRRGARTDTREAGWMPGPGYRAELLAWKVREYSEAATGGRNQALNRAAWQLGRQRVPLEEVLGALMPAASASGLGELEAEATVRSGWGAGG